MSVFLVFLDHSGEEQEEEENGDGGESWRKMTVDFVFDRATEYNW